MVCGLNEALNKLKKSSADSIDDIEKFDSFKEYMHVIRDVECDLKELLSKVNKNRKKSLILLCGSSGDGKSHLLSYLKNKDGDNLLAGYRIYNDATESSNPKIRAIDTLAEELKDFNDENIKLPGKNMIIAINLGVLSNFIESQYKNEYIAIEEFVKEQKILTSEVVNSQYDENSNIQYINFSDYHIYALDNEGVLPEYIENIFNKVFNEDINNPFFRSYKECCNNCIQAYLCPIKMNYEFLLKKNHQKYISKILVKTSIKDKQIITSREAFNFIYDIVVPENLDFRESIKESIKCFTPMLMFDLVDVSPLMDKFRKYDPLLNRTMEADRLSVNYYISSEILEQFENSIKNTPYSSIIKGEKIELIKNNQKLKSLFFKLMVRIITIDENKDSDKIYNLFLKDVYYYNINKKKKLEHVYSLVKNSVIQWCGNESDQNICIDDKFSKYKIYENIEFIEQLDNKSELDENKLKKFSSYIEVKYKNKSDKEKISLRIDYSLYELIYKLNDGYIQTFEDRNNHADFVEFISKILKTGSFQSNIIIVTSSGEKVKIEKTNFGFSFKEVI